MNIGIIGGSFDPVHHAHLIIAECFAEQFKLDKCFVVPAAVSPFKTAGFPAEGKHRLEMLRLAFKDNDRFVIDDRELRRGGTSYTIETLCEFSGEFPTAKLFLLIGGDAAEGFTRWYNWQEILTTARVCVAPRPFFRTDKGVVAQLSDMSEFTDTLQTLGVREEYMPSLVSVPALDISSSDLRERVRDGRSFRYFLPDSVREYIMAYNLYGAL